MSSVTPQDYGSVGKREMASSFSHNALPPSWNPTYPSKFVSTSDLPVDLAQGGASMLLWASICAALISGVGLVNFGSMHWVSDLAALALALSCLLQSARRSPVSEHRSSFLAR